MGRGRGLHKGEGGARPQGRRIHAAGRAGSGILAAWPLTASDAHRSTGTTGRPGR